MEAELFHAGEQETHLVEVPDPPAATRQGPEEEQEYRKWLVTGALDCADRLRSERSRDGQPSKRLQSMGTSASGARALRSVAPAQASNSSPSSVLTCMTRPGAT